MSRTAWLLLVVGLLQIVGALIGSPRLQGLGAATMIAPAPKVFSAVKGFETFSTRFFIGWTDDDGQVREVELDRALNAKFRGPYNRRNVFGAALAYGPVLADGEATRAMLAAVLRYGLSGEAPVLRELGFDPTTMSDVYLRYQPAAGSVLAGLSTRIEVPR